MKWLDFPKILTSQFERRFNMHLRRNYQRKTQRARSSPLQYADGKGKSNHDDMLVRLKNDTQNNNSINEKEIKADISEMCDNILTSSFSKFAKVSSNASKAELVSCLTVIGKTKIKFSQELIDVETLESSILNKGDEFTLIDNVALIPLFYNIGYLSKKIIEKINAHENFVTVPNTTVKEFLATLIDSRYFEQLSIYPKIFEQLKLVSANMSANEVCDVIQSITDIHDTGILENDQRIKQLFENDYT